MDLNKLKVFYFAAKAESFTNTELHISPSVVSRHISDLEHRHKIKLFYRHPRKLILTPAGKILFTTVKKILEEVSLAKSMMLNYHHEVQGLLKVFMPITSIADICMSHATDFMKQYPKLRLHICNDDNNFNKDIGDYDVAILPYKPDDGRLYAEKMTTFHLGLFASAHYIEQFGMPTHWEHLEDHQLLAYGHHNHYKVDFNWHLTTGRENKEPLEPYLSTDNLFYATQQGLGIAPFIIENYDIANNNFVRVLNEYACQPIDLYYVYPVSMKGLKSLTLFQDYLYSKLNSITNQFVENNYVAMSSFKKSHSPLLKSHMKTRLFKNKKT